MLRVNNAVYILRSIAEAQGKSELALSIHTLTAIARELIGNKSSLAGQRLIQGGVDADYLMTVDSLAEQADATGTSVTGPKKSSLVSQGELDVQDEICLLLMDQLLSAFEAAHAVNPRVPVPIPYATRHYFGTHKPSPKPAPTPSPSTV